MPTTIRPFVPGSVNQVEGLPQAGIQSTWDAMEMFRDAGLQLVTGNRVVINGVNFLATAAAMPATLAAVSADTPGGRVFQSPSFQATILQLTAECVEVYNQVTTPVAMTGNNTMFTALNTTPPVPNVGVRVDDSWLFMALTATTYKIQRKSTGLSPLQAVTAAATAVVAESVDLTMSQALGTIIVTPGSVEIDKWLFTALSPTTYTVTRVSTGAVSGTLTSSAVPNTTAIPGVSFVVAVAPALVAASKASFSTNPAVSATVDTLAIPGVDFIVAVAPALVADSAASFDTMSNLQDYDAGIRCSALGGLLKG